MQSGVERCWCGAAWCGKSQSSRTLKIGLSSHCMIVVNGTKVMVIGGASDHGNSPLTFYLDIENLDFSSPWIDGPQLLAGRVNHDCTQIGTFGPVIVAGGLKDKVEILINWQNWQHGRYIFFITQIEGAYILEVYMACFTHSTANLLLPEFFLK